MVRPFIDNVNVGRNRIKAWKYNDIVVNTPILVVNMQILVVEDSISTRI